MKIQQARIFLRYFRLTIRKGEEVTLIADGLDEEKAIISLDEFLSS
jgi:phosphotransferase system HPr-like phosphotransfer protein